MKCTLVLERRITYMHKLCFVKMARKKDKRAKKKRRNKEEVITLDEESDDEPVVVFEDDNMKPSSSKQSTNAQERVVERRMDKTNTWQSNAQADLRRCVLDWIR